MIFDWDKCMRKVYTLERNYELGNEDGQVRAFCNKRSLNEDNKSRVVHEGCSKRF